MAEIRAGGFIVFRRRADEIQYLTLRTRKTDEWGPPKGHNDPGESDLDAAWRETEEESGLARKQLRRHDWFERRLNYPVKRGDKTVWYGLAERREGKVRLSKEHTDFRWQNILETCARIPHANLRHLYIDAATFLKDRHLRTEVDTERLFRERFPSQAPVIDHTAMVVDMAWSIGESWPGVDPDFAARCAWVHDIGRSVEHGPRHLIEGFRIMTELGHPAFAPTCISHFVKGRSFEEIGDRELWSACDLSSFEPHERVVALADYMALRESKGTLEQRHADLIARYGASDLLDGGYRAAHALKEEFERVSGRDLYDVAGVRA
ncbi:MAG: NUDIX domain-containing protein [Planctomycetota bacterium]